MRIIGYILAAVLVVGAALGLGGWLADRSQPDHRPVTADLAAPAGDEQPTGAPAATTAAAGGTLPVPSPSKPPPGARGPTKAGEDGAGLLRRVAQERWRGDFGAMRDRRIIRFLVTHNQTNFFVREGRARGFEAELIHEFEAFMNRTMGDGTPWTMVPVPVPFSQLIPRLLAGEGDVIAAGMTITPERAAKVGFSDPYLGDVREIVVSNAAVEGLDTLADLAGRTVHVSAGRSYAGHLRAVSERLVAAGRSPIEIVEVDPRLETEDLLHLVNGGMLEATVADDHLAAAWAPALRDLVLHDDLVVHGGGAIGWAVRPDNPELRTQLNAFVADHQQGTLLGNVLFQRYFKSDTWLRDPMAPEEHDRLDTYADLFKEYGALYRFDWLLLAAIAFQESGLDPKKVSPAGAVGLMQLRPSTAAQPAIGLPKVEDVETNVHAAAKYLDFIRNRYFDRPEIAAAAQVDFTLAAYNAGPARVTALRDQAAGRGLDPNRWFENVEMTAFDVIGHETVDYVANINKYYLAYKLGLERASGRREAVETIGGAE